MVASFIPYGTKRIYNNLTNSEESNALLFYGPSSAIGAVSGSLISATCIAPLKRQYGLINLTAMAIGAGYGLLYTYMLRNMLKKRYAAIETEKTEYGEDDFRL